MVSSLLTNLSILNNLVETDLFYIRSETSSPKDRRLTFRMLLKNILMKENKNRVGLTWEKSGNNTVTFSSGIFVSDDADINNRMLGVFNSPMTKIININWVSGDNQGMLDSGSISNDTWYYLWAIANYDYTPDIIASSNTIPSLPTNYVYRRLIGCIRYLNGQLADMKAEYEGDRIVVRYLNPSQFPLAIDATLANANTRYSFDLSASGVQVIPPFAGRMTINCNVYCNNPVYFTTEDETDLNVSTSAPPLATCGIPNTSAFYNLILTCKNATIKVTTSTANTTLRMSINSFYFPNFQ